MTSQPQSWIATLLPLLQDAQTVAVITIAEVKGSAPREAGATLFVTSDTQIGTIGGGSLEFDAIGLARQHLRTATTAIKRLEQSFVLGPDLGQCCGGQVHLLIEFYHHNRQAALQSLYDSGAQASLHDFTNDQMPTPLTDNGNHFSYDRQTKQMRRPLRQQARSLYIYGAGHIGRALLPLTSALGFTRIWVDVDKERFPLTYAPDITLVPAKDMALIAKNAPEGAYHIIVTYSHQIDESICHALLSAGQYGRIGLIGSQTKKARFASRLAQAGHQTARIDDIICPIGLKDIRSKLPAHVALSIASQLAVWLEADS